MDAPVRLELTSALSFGGQVFNDNLHVLNVQGDSSVGPNKPTLTSYGRRAVTTDTRQREVNAGFFLQEQLGWNDRLTVTAGVRVDGNSSFGEDFGLQTYPKVGVAYMLSDHSFWPSQWIETFKLRVAFGESGKAPGAFDAGRTWGPSPAMRPRPASARIRSAIRTSVPSARASWRLASRQVRSMAASTWTSRITTRAPSTRSSSSVSPVGRVPQRAARERRRASEHRYRAAARGRHRPARERRLARARELHVDQQRGDRPRRPARDPDRRCHRRAGGLSPCRRSSGRRC